MNKPLMKYSKLVNMRSKIFLYLIFFVMCGVVGIIYGIILPIVPMSTVKLMLLPILLLGLVGIWMMPEKTFFLENKLRTGFFMFLAFWLVWPPYLSLIKLPGDPWMSPQRILIYVMLVLALLMFSVSKNAKHILRDNYRENKTLFISMLVYIFACLISIFFSASMETSLTAFIKDLMFNFLVFFLAISLISNDKYIKSIFLICIFSALILGLMSFYENTLNQTIWSYHIPRSMFANSEITEKILSAKFRFGEYRVKGSSLTSLEYAELLSYTLPMCIYYFLNNTQKIFKVLILLTILVIFYAIIVSRSRLGLVGALISISSYSLLIALRNWNMNKQSLVGAAMLIFYPAGLAVISLLIAFSTTLTNMIFGSSTSGHGDSTQARYEMWEKGLPLIAERPIFGHGLNMGAETLSYTTPGGTVTIDTFILSIALETGLIGVISFLTFCIFGCLKASKAFINCSEKDAFTLKGAAIASILITFIAIKIVLSQRYNHTIIFMLLGIITHYRIYRGVKKDIRNNEI